LIHRYCAECITAKTPELYRVCGISIRLNNAIAVGTRNHNTCDENNVSDGSNLRHPVCRDNFHNPYADSATNPTPSTTCSHRLTAAGIPSDTNSGSLECPVWNPRNSIRYDATNAPYSACRVPLSGSAPARRANIMN